MSAQRISLREAFAESTRRIGFSAGMGTMAGYGLYTGDWAPLAVTSLSVVIGAAVIAVAGRRTDGSGVDAASTPPEPAKPKPLTRLKGPRSNGPWKPAP